MTQARSTKSPQRPMFNTEGRLGARDSNRADTLKPANAQSPPLRYPRVVFVDGVD